MMGTFSEIRWRAGALVRMHKAENGNAKQVHIQGTIRELSGNIQSTFGNAK
jgi:hypothetical protein